ncbi:MAG: tetratricopeptide repeat protein [Pyrinomonadaceae bacterium]|nr:tetratricopeptide repeat protein [Pyrinomonadaceae bacterium]
MPAWSRFKTNVFALALMLAVMCASASKVAAQTRDDFDAEDAADPVKLFERCQDFHQKGNLQLAIECYEEALKVRPEFPEAEFQKGAALAALNRTKEAEQAFHRAAELRRDWALPQLSLAVLLARSNRGREAEPFFRRTLQLDPKNQTALIALADLRARAGDPREAVELARRATTSDGNTPAAVWASRGMFENAAGDKVAAAASFERALALDANEPTARVNRAEMRATAGEYTQAVEDMRASLKASPPSERTRLSLRLARFLGLAGMKDEARRVLTEVERDGSLSAEGTREVAALRIELEDAPENTPEARAALEQLLERDARNATLLARLGGIYRTIDPARSLEYFRRAVEVEPSNIDYATGYAAALVQARRFEPAATILRRIITVAPENYTAHANLATALDELKRYREALAEYIWIREKRPDLAVTNFFIARAHDMLGEYKEALAAYETFLTKADAQINGLEIEKVKLRLPSLRNQAARGEGSKGRKKR